MFYILFFFIFICKNTYKKIMKTINQFINEAKKPLKRDEHDLVKWFNMDKSNFITFDDDDLENIHNLLSEYISSGNMGTYDLAGLDKDCVIDIAGHIVEAQIYEALKLKLPWYIFNNAEKFGINAEDIDNITATKRAGRGLKAEKGKEKYPIYWDFSFNGIDEKFEVKTKCSNGYKQGGFDYTPNQKNNKGFIEFSCTYTADDGSYTIDVDSFKVKRY